MAINGPKFFTQHAYRYVTTGDLLPGARIYRVPIGDKNRRNRRRHEDPATFADDLTLAEEPVRNGHLYFRQLPVGGIYVPRVDTEAVSLSLIFHQSSQHVYIVPENEEPVRRLHTGTFVTNFPYRRPLREDLVPGAEMLFVWMQGNEEHNARRPADDPATFGMKIRLSQPVVREIYGVQNVFYIFVPDAVGQAHTGLNHFLYASDGGSIYLVRTDGVPIPDTAERYMRELLESKRNPGNLRLGGHRSYGEVY